MLKLCIVRCSYSGHKKISRCGRHRSISDIGQCISLLSAFSFSILSLFLLNEQLCICAERQRRPPLFVFLMCVRVQALWRRSRNQFYFPRRQIRVLCSLSLSLSRSPSLYVACGGEKDSFVLTCSAVFFPLIKGSGMSIILLHVLTLFLFLEMRKNPCRWDAMRFFAD